MIPSFYSKRTHAKEMVNSMSDDSLVLIVRLKKMYLIVKQVPISYAKSKEMNKSNISVLLEDLLCSKVQFSMLCFKLESVMSETLIPTSIEQKKGTYSKEIHSAFK